MASFIKNRTIVEDNWQRLDAAQWLQVGESGLVADFPTHGDLLAPLRLWRLRGDELHARGGGLGLRIEAWAEPEEFSDLLPKVQLVAIEILQFTDGRAYSLARLLRERYRYEGKLRAEGDVLRDQLYYLWRCGFDAFALKDPGRSGEALASLGDFSEAYQSSVERPQPLFRRRRVAGTSSMRWSAMPTRCA